MKFVTLFFVLCSPGTLWLWALGSRRYVFSSVSGRERSLDVAGRRSSVVGCSSAVEGRWSLAGTLLAGGLPTALAPVAKTPLLITPVVPVVPAASPTRSVAVGLSK